MANHKKLKNKKSGSSKDSKKQERNSRFIGIFLAVLMVASLAGIAIGGISQTDTSSNQYVYGDYKFELRPIQGTLESLLVTEINDREVGFYSLPQDALRLNVRGNLSILRDSQYAVLSGNPNETFMSVVDVFRYEISQATDKQVGGGVLFPSENYTSYPTVSCLNSSSTVPVITLEEANETIIIVNESNSCVQIKSRVQDLLYVRDLLLYRMLGVLN